jgi:hypothetical protein
LRNSLQFASDLDRLDKYVDIVRLKQDFEKRGRDLSRFSSYFDDKEEKERKKKKRRRPSRKLQIRENPRSRKLVKKKASRRSPIMVVRINKKREIIVVALE